MCSVPSYYSGASLSNASFVFGHMDFPASFLDYQFTNSEIIRHKPVFRSGSKRSANVCALRNRDIPRVNYEERTAVPGLLRSDIEPTKFYF